MNPKRLDDTLNRISPDGPELDEELNEVPSAEWIPRFASDLSLDHEITVRYRYSPI
jgi:hypothetical protein